MSREAIEQYIQGKGDNTQAPNGTGWAHEIAAGAPHPAEYPADTVDRVRHEIDQHWSEHQRGVDGENAAAQIAAAEQAVAEAYGGTQGE